MLKAFLDLEGWIIERPFTWKCFSFFCFTYSDASEDKREELNCEFSLLPDFQIVQISQITLKKFQTFTKFTKPFFNFCYQSSSKATWVRMCVHNKVTWSNHANFLLSVRVFAWCYSDHNMFGITWLLVSFHVQGTLCIEWSPKTRRWRYKLNAKFFQFYQLYESNSIWSWRLKLRQSTMSLLMSTNPTLVSATLTLLIVADSPFSSHHFCRTW